MSLKSAPVAKQAYDWLSLIQFSASGLAIAGGLLLSFGLLLGGLSAAWLGSEQANTQLAASNQLGLLAASLLLLPSAYHALRRMLGRPSRSFSLPGRRFGLSIWALPLAMAAAYWALQAGQDWLLPWLYLLPAVLVVGWLVWLALRGLQAGSAQRVWGALASGLVGVTSFSFLLEALGGIFILGGVGLYVQLTPELTRAIEALMQASESVDDVALLAPFLNDPVILLAAFFSLSIMVPLIEELFKPLAVYLLLRRPLSNAQGFALGALSGAGFALAENVFLSAPADTLAVAVAGRSGASAMHILTGALGGYAAVRAKRQGKYWGLAGAYALNVFIHAVWNGLVLLTAASAVSAANSGGLVPAEFAVLAPALLAALGAGCAYFIWRTNHKLQTNQNA